MGEVQIFIGVKQIFKEMKMQNHYSVSTHFGVYGVVKNQGKVMCIKKRIGPYKNRFDLPGGSQENWEGLTETLCREIKEETGYTVRTYHNPRAYDSFVREKNKLNVVHHIMIFYDVELDKNIKKGELPSLLQDGLNDSDGIIWVAFEDITEMNASPLLLKLKKEHEGRAEMQKSQFMEWNVN